MKISVVTVARNSAATIRWTIESFLAQTWTNSELILIDGVSTDGTVTIAEAYCDPRIRIVSEPDRGLYDAMNKGLRLFRGDAVGFLNSDDRYHDAHVLAAIAEALAGSDAVTGDLDFVSDHETRRVLRRWRGTAFRPGAFREGWMPAHPTFYLRRALAERTGMFDTRYRIAADYDYMLRALEGAGAAVRVAHLDRVMVDMMAGGASTAGVASYMRGNLESLRARRTWLGAGIVDLALVTKPFGKIGQFIRR